MNKEKRIIYMKQYRIDNKERIAKLSKLRYDKWIKNNKEYIKNYMRNYIKKRYKNNLEGIKKRSKLWRENNKEKKIEYQKMYRIKNKTKLREYDNRYYKKNKDAILKKHKKYINNIIKEEKSIKYAPIVADQILYYDDYITNYNNKHIIDCNEKFYDWVLLRADIIIRDNFTCKMCKRHFKYNLSVLTAHHIISRKNNGSDDPKNLMTLCKHCHDIAELYELDYKQIIDYYKFA